MKNEQFQYWYKAHVKDVYDGDTITVDLQLGCFTSRINQKVRFLGLNTPEVRGVERAEGSLVRDALRARILGKDIIINTHLDKNDKYGRLLAVVWLDGENINEWLLQNGHATPYMEI